MLIFPVKSWVYKVPMETPIFPAMWLICVWRSNSCWRNSCNRKHHKWSVDFHFHANISLFWGTVHSFIYLWLYVSLRKSQYFERFFSIVVWVKEITPAEYLIDIQLPLYSVYTHLQLEVVMQIGYSYYMRFEYSFTKIHQKLPNPSFLELWSINSLLISAMNGTVPTDNLINLNIQIFPDSYRPIRSSLWRAKEKSTAPCIIMRIYFLFLRFEVIHTQYAVDS